MRILVHVNKFYDWEPLPADVVPTPADIKANRVKPTATGSWLMRVPKEANTFTDVQIPESEIVSLIIHDAVKEGMFHTRAEAAGHWLGRHIAQHHFHRNWVTKIEAVDDGPVATLLDAEYQRMLSADLLKEEDRALLFEKYEEVFTNDQLAEHFYTRLGAKKEVV